MQVSLKELHGRQHTMQFEVALRNQCRACKARLLQCWVSERFAIMLIKGATMKQFSALLAAMFVTLSSIGFADGHKNNVKGYVIKKTTDTRFVFQADVTGDNCNSFILDTSLQRVSKNLANRKRTYKVTAQTSMTVMECEDMRPVPAKAVSQVYKVPAGDEVRFIVPAEVTIKILE